MKMGRRRSQNFVKLIVRNVAGKPIDVVLEPFGEIHQLAAGTEKIVTYAGDPRPTLAIDAGDDDLTLYAEGPGTLDVDENDG